MRGHHGAPILTDETTTTLSFFSFFFSCFGETSRRFTLPSSPAGRRGTNGNDVRRENNFCARIRSCPRHHETQKDTYSSLTLGSCPTCNNFVFHSEVRNRAKFSTFQKTRQETVRSRKRTSHVTVQQRDLGEKKKTISSLVGFFQLTSSALRARIKLLYLSQSSDSGMWRRKLFYGRCPTGANSMVSTSPCLEIFNTDG